MRPKTYWPHDETCCAREVSVGDRFERDLTDWSTGEKSVWRCTVIAVAPVDCTRIFCRRATVQGDDGRSCQPFVQDLFSERYRAIDNIVSLRRTTKGGGE